MMPRRLINAALLLGLCCVPAGAQQAPADQPPTVTFRSSVDLVRVSAVVRDRKGRLVRGMKVRDFEVRERGELRRIKEFRAEVSGVSVAFLFDISGSMESRMTHAREEAELIMAWMANPDDEAAVYTFDTRLDEVTPFTEGLRKLPAHLATITPFGATSLYDAIARTAERTAERDGFRRAVVVLTDGGDNASRMNAGEVSGIASSIDVPVYVIGLVSAIDNPWADISATTFERSALTGPLSDLAVWTGGQAFVASTATERSQTAKQIVDELRHHYLLAFESSDRPGWHPLEVRTRDRDLTVRARSGYFAGQSRPISQ